MSTWGGIGEGLAAGMNARIALEEQRRREANAQKNADREFAFRQEQANRAQSNADRAFDASREDAENAQTNADKAFSFREREADRAQANADRQFGLQTDIAQANIDNADREFALKRESQDWANQLNGEKLRSFRTANDKLDAEWKKQQEIEEAQKESGRRQLALALYRVNGAGGVEQDIQVAGPDGKPTTVKAKVLPQDQMRRIFGSDGIFKYVQNVVSFKDDKGNPMSALVRPNGTMQTFSREELYDVYSSGVDKAFADSALQDIKDKRDLGMFTAKEDARAMAHAKAVRLSDQYSDKRGVDAAIAILRDPDASDKQKEASREHLLTVFSGNVTGGNSNATAEWVGANGKPMTMSDIMKLKAAGYDWDRDTGRPKLKRPTVSAPGKTK